MRRKDSKLKLRLRFAISILVGLIFALSSAGAMAHCPDMPSIIKSGPFSAEHSDHGLQEVDQADAHHGHNDHSHSHTKKAGNSANMCTGSGVALIEQCKFDHSPRLLASQFALTVQSVISLSVPPASEPPRI